MDIRPLYIDSDSGLAALCRRLASSRWLALDTEFVRDKTYFPKFCLLQIATPEVVACVDPLAVNTLDPLLDIIYTPRAVKIFHAARQDLEILYYLRGELPAPIFDTQIAASLVGLSEQPSYAALVAELLSVTLSKAHTRADWARRPLPDEHLSYAAEDVIYLGGIYSCLHARLSSLRRLEWLEEDARSLLRPDLYVNEPEVAWQRIRGAERLGNAHLAALKVLAAWRERTACRENRPRAWLIRDDLMIALARSLPENLDALTQVSGLQPALVKRHGRQLCRILADAKRGAGAADAVTPSAARRTPEQEDLVQRLTALVRQRARQLCIAPSALASRKEIDALISRQDSPRLLQGWRKHVIGVELETVIRNAL